MIIVMILGLVLWTGLHLVRSGAPNLRHAMTDRLGGNGAKGVLGIGIVVSVVLMVIGYRGAEFIAVWTPPAVFGYLNNFLMFFALYVYFVTATKPGTAWMMGDAKNPQLTGFTIWAFAHLLVNGDLASILLFGGLLGWAIAEIKASRKTVSLVDRNTAKISNPVVHLGLVIVAIIIITGIHTALGYNPFGAL